MTEKTQMIADLKQIIRPYIQNEEAFNELNEETDFVNDLKGKKLMGVL